MLSRPPSFAVLRSCPFAKGAARGGVESYVCIGHRSFTMTLPPILSVPDPKRSTVWPHLPDGVRIIVAAFCNLVPLLCAFRFSSDEVQLAYEFASSLSDTILFVWPTPDNMFPWCL